MKNYIKHLIVLVLSSITLNADIHSDLQDLLVEGNTLNSELTSFTLYQDSSCMKMGTLNQSIEGFTLTVDSTIKNMIVFTVTDADLNALKDLSYLTKNMSFESMRLSLELTSITDSADLFQYKAGLSAILQLSKDIGAMADRILEMSDRILIMADNIGNMADAIITTQVIQSENLAVTQNSILITQQNMILLSDSLSTIAYNLSLGQISDDANILSIAMDNVNLNSENMDVELAQIQTLTNALFNKTSILLNTVVMNSTQASNYINSDTLSMLGDLSKIYAALGTSIEIYANTMEQIAPDTDITILSNSINTMLQLTKDIGVMSDRIIEMTNDIFIMADNIGLMSDRIVETQNIQVANVKLTESSLLASQTIIISVIKNFGL